jgi:hypothetical protein
MMSHFSSAASMTQTIRSGVGRLSDDKRKAIALQALARTEPISLETAIEMRKNVGNSHMAGLCANLAHSPDW